MKKTIFIMGALLIFATGAFSMDFTGAGVRFLSFVGEGRHRLELFLRRGTS